MDTPFPPAPAGPQRCGAASRGTVTWTPGLGLASALGKMSPLSLKNLPKCSDSLGPRDLVHLTGFRCGDGAVGESAGVSLLLLAVSCQPRCLCC